MGPRWVRSRHAGGEAGACLDVGCTQRGCCDDGAPELGVWDVVWLPNPVDVAGCACMLEEMGGLPRDISNAALHSVPGDCAAQPVHAVVEACMCVTRLVALMRLLPDSQSGSRKRDVRFEHCFVCPYTSVLAARAAEASGMCRAHQAGVDSHRVWICGVVWLVHQKDWDASATAVCG